MNDIVDMTQFVEAKSDQLNSDDLLGTTAENGKIITVRKVVGNDGDQPISIYYEGDNNKPFKPCKTIRRVLLGVWGKFANDYVGRSMMIYRDDSVTFGGLAVGGIRISQMSHIDKPVVVVVMKTKGKKAGIKIEPLQVAAAKPDKAAAGAQKLAETIRTTDDLPGVLADPDVIKQREWLHKNRPQLAQEIEEAIRSRASDDPFTDPQEGRADSDMGEGFVEEPDGE